VNALFEQLGESLDLESYEWLIGAEPLIAAGLEAAIRQGATPEQVRRFTVRRTGRQELALRLEQAARYLVKLGEE
jgi:hypothetical protein